MAVLSDRSRRAERNVQQSNGYRGLGVGAALVALSAFGGAVGLIGGGLSIGDKLNRRLPFDSPVLGGLALAMLVGVPFSVLARRAWSHHPKTGFDAQLAGVMLVGWLLVELLFIREFSFFHPLYSVIGVAFVVAGWLMVKGLVSQHAPTTVEADAVQRFLALKRIALVGASADPKKFGNTIFRELVTHGYDVVPANPQAKAINGVACVSRVAEANPPVEGVMIMVSGPAALAAVQECVALGIKQVWLFRGAGSPGAMSDATYGACKDAGIDVVAGACPLMFLKPVAKFHQAHLVLRRLDGSLVGAA